MGSMSISNWNLLTNGKNILSEKDIGKTFVIKSIENSKSLFAGSYSSIISLYVYDKSINKKVEIKNIDNRGASGIVNIKGYNVKIYCDDLISLNEHRKMKLKRINETK